MKEVFHSICKTLQRNWLSLLVFDLVYRVAMFSLLAVGMDHLLDFSMDLMGYSYVTLGNLGDFLLNPFSMLVILTALLLLLVLTLTELSALFYCYEYAEHHMFIGPAAMLLLGAERALRILKRLRLKNLFWMFLLLPFLYHPILLILFYRYGVWGQMLSFFFSGNAFVPAVIAVFLLVFASGIVTMFLIPCVIIEEVSIKKTWWLIRKYFRKYLLRGGRYLLHWNVMLTLGHFALYVISVFLMGAILHLKGGEKELLYVQALDCHNWILLILMALFSFVCLLLNSSLIYQLYSKVKRNEQINPDFLHVFEHPAAKIPRKKRILSAMIVITLIGAEIFGGVVFVRHSYVIAGSPFESVQITAHRGNSIDTPENTMVALESAMEQMADFAEIDVQITADGVVVLLHDISLLRTCGVSENLYDMSYLELQELDAGSYMGEGFAGEKIPALAQVLELCKGKMNLNIELKSHSKYQDHLVSAVVRLVESHHMENQCVLTSMNYNYLRRVKEENPDIRTGYIVRNLYGSLEHMVAADFIAIRHTGITPTLIERAHKAGKEVWCWTVNSPSEVKKMCSMNVDNIITDNPAMVRSVIAEDTYSLELMDLFEMLIFTE